MTDPEIRRWALELAARTYGHTTVPSEIIKAAEAFYDFCRKNSGAHPAPASSAFRS